MRFAVALFAVIGCAKPATDKAPAVTASIASPGSNKAAPMEPPPPPPHQEAQQARDHARAQGVLGPTEGSAFIVKGSVTIKRSDQQLDAIVKPRLDKLQACYDHALEMQEALAGELTIAIKDGKPSVQTSTLKHVELEKCVLDALADALLPRKATLVLAFKRA